MNEWRIPQPTFNADIHHVTISTDDPEIGRAILMAYGEKLGANGMKSEGNLIAQLRAYPAHYTAAHEAADEIERLREMIEWMENMDPRLVDDARAALAEQETEDI